MDNDFFDFALQLYLCKTPVNELKYCQFTDGYYSNINREFIIDFNKDNIVVNRDNDGQFNFILVYYYSDIFYQYLKWKILNE